MNDEYYSTIYFRSVSLVLTRVLSPSIRRGPFENVLGLIMVIVLLLDNYLRSDQAGRT